MLKRTCSEKCKEFRVSKPTGIGRYASGQCRCQICDIWMDYRGCHLADYTPATADSGGWYCNCCNYKVRKTPRNLKYKTKLRNNDYAKTKAETDISDDGFIVHKKVDNVYNRLEESDLIKELEKTKEELSEIVNWAASTRRERYPEWGKGGKQETKSEPYRNKPDADNRELPIDIKMHVQNMLDEFSTLKHRIDKNVKMLLIKEYLNFKSIKKIMERHPEMSNTNVKLHVRTPLRLPEKLQALNREGLHPDPEYSLHIALYAVNYHDWDGQKDTEEEVISMAESMAKYIISNARLEQTTQNKPQEIPHKYGERMGKEDMPTAIAVWVATATLQREHGPNFVFTNNQIIEKIAEQKTCNVSDRTISDHIAGRCVANAPTTTPGVHRKIYRVSQGRYRLYKKGDPFHHTRKRCKAAPLPFQLPDKYRELKKWYDEIYCKS